MDEAHARVLIQEMLNTIVNGKRFQPRRAKTYRRAGSFIYAIQLLDGHRFPIKIGITSDIDKRIKMFLTHQPYGVKVLGTWAGSARDERDLHAMFAGSHLAREWFAPSADLLAYIESKARA
jgi:hypothetical protein